MTNQNTTIHTKTSFKYGLVRIIVLFYVLAIYSSLLYTPLAQSQEDDEIPPILVVTDLRTLGHKASLAEARAFSQFIREEIEATGEYRLISDSSMASILKSRNFTKNCHELPCFVQMGKILGADQILAGHLQRINDEVEITLRLINVNEEQIINTVYRQAYNLPSGSLMGDWGRQLIMQTFNLSPQDFDLPKTPAPLPDDVKLEQIEPEVKNKYPSMIYIPKGSVLMGSNDGDLNERPQHRIDLEAYYIGKYEVTNQEYKDFVMATGHRAPPHWTGTQIPAGKEKHPVVWISYEDAVAYCEWKDARLPTEAEWERAAKSTFTYEFPWGDTFDENRANTWETGRKDTAPIGSFPLGDSPFEVEDMAGNAFEWVDGKYEPYPNSPAKSQNFDQNLNVLRGGSWNFNSYYARTTHRFPRPATEIARTYGFRIARSK